MVDSRLPTVKQSAPRGFFPARVLVVDPEPLTRWSICMALAAAGFDADSAASLEEARVAAAAGYAPRVILLDVHPDVAPQPQIDELQTISPGSRVIVMSTRRHPARPLQSQEDVGAIEKPFDLTTLVSIVSGFARRPSPAGSGR